MTPLQPDRPTLVVLVFGLMTQLPYWIKIILANSVNMVFYHHNRSKCDRACENRACGHIIFAYVYYIFEIITFYPNILWQWKFQHLVQIYLALWCRLQNQNILFQYWDMTFRVTGCSLCPHALFSQAQSQIGIIGTLMIKVPTTKFNHW